MTKMKQTTKPVMSIRTETITPEIARKWMEETNTNNRILKSFQVKHYAAQMKNGDWLSNGESIKFSSDGVLLDGQHRLEAMVMANKTLDMIVIRGLDPETFKTIDTGKKRNANDALYIKGFNNATTVAGALRIIKNIEDRKKDIYPGIFKTARVTNASLLDLANKYPELQDVCETAYHEYRAAMPLLSPSIVTALLFLFTQKSPKLATEFFIAISTGRNLGADSVILNIREKLIKNRSSLRKLPNGDKIVLAIKAWNALRDGITDGKLVVAPNAIVKKIH